MDGLNTILCCGFLLVFENETHFQLFEKLLTRLHIFTVALYLYFFDYNGFAADFPVFYDGFR